VELTHDVNMFLPLLVATVIAHLFTVLTLKRSILTEKVSRRGFHLSREYAVDPLEILFAREVMRTKVVALPAGGSLADLRRIAHGTHKQSLYPIVDAENRLHAVITRQRMPNWQSLIPCPPFRRCPNWATRSPWSPIRMSRCASLSIAWPKPD
jgi:hypothetical protein